ncbi:HEAT repeat domain-containing protein, partial [Streptomyces sp. NPDC058989]|uniref:HEAT repeat domain-containing protein n=1 Tax=Streptomyces sp. NPDC058989 TaxID=3346686 RepID=UPI0036AB8091
LTESVPPGTGPALAVALADPDAAVRAAAAASLRELVEVLVAEPELRAPLAAAAGGPDPLVRSSAVDVLRALRLGDRPLFAAALADPVVDVRIQAVRALVSVDAAEELRRAAKDASREVRVAAAHALGTVGGATDLAALLHDEDVLVRAAALGALATTGCPPPYEAPVVAALGDAAWQVRAGAAQALAAARPDAAVAALRGALGDGHADVRKAAVLALRAHVGRADARGALAAVADDPDADVRAYARLASKG